MVMIDRRATVLGLAPALDDANQPCGRCGRSASQPSPGRLNGLSGHVSQAFEVVDRMEQAAEALRQALHTELSAGIERHVAAVRADAASVIVAANAERDIARQEADAARAAQAQARRDTMRAEDTTRRTHVAATHAVQAVQAAQTDLVRVRDQAEEAVAAAEQRLRDELDPLRERLASAERERDTARADLAAAQEQLEQAQEQLANVGERVNGMVSELTRMCRG